MDVADFNTQCHVRPPLRTERDRDALRQGLARGAISAICSDHQPHEPDAKLRPFYDTEPGISGLETLLPLALRLVDDRLLDMRQVISALTRQPAKILGISAGTLTPGERADVCIFDPEKYWTLEAKHMASAGRNSPFIGWDLKGQVTHTLLAGKSVYESESP
jgi:dihydroorotase